MSADTNTIVTTGRRKTSSARVRLTDGSGKLTINGRALDSYFTHENFAKQAYAPLLTVEMRDKIDIDANVTGGGMAARPSRWRTASPARCRSSIPNSVPCSRKPATSSATRAKRNARRPASLAPANASSSRSVDRKRKPFQSGAPMRPPLFCFIAAKSPLVCQNLLASRSPFPDPFFP